MVLWDNVGYNSLILVIECDRMPFTTLLIFEPNRFFLFIIIIIFSQRLLLSLEVCNLRKIILDAPFLGLDTLHTLRQSCLFEFFCSTYSVSLMVFSLCYCYFWGTLLGRNALRRQFLSVIPIKQPFHMSMVKLRLNQANLKRYWCLIINWFD